MLPNVFRSKFLSATRGHSLFKNLQNWGQNNNKKSKYIPVNNWISFDKSHDFNELVNQILWVVMTKTMKVTDINNKVTDIENGFCHS